MTLLNCGCWMYPCAKHWPFNRNLRVLIPNLLFYGLACFGIVVSAWFIGHAIRHAEEQQRAKDVACWSLSRTPGVRWSDLSAVCPYEVNHGFAEPRP